MSSTSDRILNRIAAAGLLVGAGFGLAGALVASAHVQASLWAIDSVALVIATSLLALKYFRAGADIVAAGFLVFAIGEGVAALGHCRGASGECARLRRGHGAVGRRAGPHQCAAPAEAMAAIPGRWHRLSVRRHCCAHLRGRGAVAHLIPAPVLCLSVPRRHVAGLGVDARDRGVLTRRPGSERKRSASPRSCRSPVSRDRRGRDSPS